MFLFAMRVFFKYPHHHRNCNLTRNDEHLRNSVSCLVDGIYNSSSDYLYARQCIAIETETSAKFRFEPNSLMWPLDERTFRLRQTVHRTVRRIRHVDFLGQSAGQSARLNKTWTVRRTVREIIQIIAVNQALTFGR
jgi:hypothetical protein